MKCEILLIGLTLLLCVGTAFGFRTPERAYLSSADGGLIDLSPHPAHPAQLLAVSSRSLFRRNGKNEWKRLLTLSTDTSLRQLILHPAVPEKVYLVAEEGLLEGDLKNGRSRWLFRHQPHLENSVHSMALDPRDPKQIYLATDAGLFLSGDAGETWLPSFRWPENQPLHLVAFLPALSSSMLLGTDRELFFSRNAGEVFESGFSLPARATEREEDFEDEDSSPPPAFTSVAFSIENPEQLWIGTREGIYQSSDGGEMWEKLPDRGLQYPGVRDLIFSKDGRLVGAFPDGVARYNPSQQRWEKIPLGSTEAPRALALSPSRSGKGDILLVASGNQILEWVLEPLETEGGGSFFLPSPERLDLFKRLLQGEPTIREIQSAAIRYGGVGNGKIRRWHWGSRMRAFVPRLTFSKSFAIGNNVDIDRGGTNDADRFILGPEDLSRDWDLGLTWELGDFLYSTAQTSIDSRQKLLVELRESLLSQVTRLYFERRRVQMEMAFSDAKSLDEHFDRLLRLDELTAQIDTLTDGFLTKRLDRLYEEEPDLKELWDAAMKGLTL